MDYKQPRALTEHDKRIVVERLLYAWKQLPNLRLGQLIASANGASKPDTSIFFVEDLQLVQAVEALAEEQRSR